MLWAGSMFACFFLSALYLQGVLGYDALQVGLAYLPSCAVMAATSVWLSDKLVMTYGVRPPLVAGLALVAASLALFAIAPVDGVFVVHVLPPMVLLGLGAGIAFNPVLLAAMGDVEPHEAGLASGVVNTSFMMGGALGLAVLVAISSSRTSSLVASGEALPEALTGGYQVAFAAGAVMAALAAVIGGVFLRPQPMGGADAHGAPVEASASPSRPRAGGLRRLTDQSRGSPVHERVAPRRRVHRPNVTGLSRLVAVPHDREGATEAEGLIHPAGGGAVVLDGEVQLAGRGGGDHRTADRDHQVPSGAPAARGVRDGDEVEVALAVGLHPAGGVPEQPRPVRGDRRPGTCRRAAPAPGARRWRTTRGTPGRATAGASRRRRAWPA